MKYFFLAVSLLPALMSCSSPIEPQGSLDALGTARGFARTASERGQPTLSHEARLRKLSLHLRGVTPELAEYEELKNAPDAAQFFEKKTTEYLKSPRYVAKMVDRLDTLFRLKLSSGLPESRDLNLLQVEPDPTLNPGGDIYNAMDFLFAKIAKDNLSWDALLTNKNYFVQNPEPTALRRVSDLAFFKPIAPELPEPLPPSPVFSIPVTSGAKSYELLKTNFKETDSRLAGAISTSRFLARYSTTNLNKSRGRAAAIFRIFMCDDMRAVVEPKADEEAELLNNAFPKPISRELLQSHVRADEEKHGSQAACMACHYKLDPMGSAFINYSTNVALEPANGALVFKRADGTLVEEKGKGLGEVLAFITKQPEYATCQVSHFWKWFVRGDKLPPESRMKELVAKFNQLGRKTNDFVQYLVSQPEFYVHPDAIVVSTSISDVKPVLQRCDECHAGVTTDTIPSFIKLPIGGTDKEHREWLTNIADKLDLKHGGVAKQMPPTSSAWQPTNQEIISMKDWIRQGAKGEDEKETIDEAFAKGLVE